MTDPRYMRPGLPFATGKAVEELGELIAALGKTLRWGWGSFNPELPEGERETNAQWVRREVADLRGALDNLEKEMRANDLLEDAKHAISSSSSEALSSSSNAMRIAELERQNGDLLAANIRFEARARDAERRLKTADEEKIAPPTPRFFRHRKRGSVYVRVGWAGVQAAEPIEEGEIVTVYRGVADGRLWARRSSEFDDGRFEDVTKKLAAPI